MFDTKKIKQDAKKDFEKTWTSTTKLLPTKTRIKLKKKGTSHAVNDLINRSRQILLGMGFDEITNLTILTDEDVYKQYGPESPVILDRVFYLAKMPRPDIGLSNEKIKQIKKIIGNFNANHLKEILRAYKKGNLEGDDFVEEMVTKLKIKTEQATKIIDNVFPELKKLKPIPTNLTLRSHMTATWYHTLASLQNKRKFPISLFSIGQRYRNEQKEDAGHLRVHNSISLVIMDPKMSLDSGRDITKNILGKFGFKVIKFVKKAATSKYYADGQEEEVFVKYKDKWIEVADIGMYSAISLANFDIKYPVFNAGFGVERLVMILKGLNDIRKVVYPQFYAETSFSDKDLAQMIGFREKPATEIGKKIAKKISKAILKYKTKIGPQKFLVYRGRGIKVFVSEPEENKKLLGPAGLNVVYVYNNDIIGVNPKDKKFKDVIKNGVRVCTYVDAIAQMFASRAEKNRFGKHTVKLADTLHSINLELEPAAEKYITSQNKTIDIRGPIFVDAEIEKNGK